MTPNAGRLLILCLPILLISCASQPTVPEAEVITLTKKVLVPVPPALAQPVPVPHLSIPLSTVGLGQVYSDTLRALLIANKKLTEISNLSVADNLNN